MWVPAGGGGWGRGTLHRGPWPLRACPRGGAQCLAGGPRPPLCPEAWSQVSGSLCSPLRLPPAAPGPTLRSSVGGGWVGGWQGHARGFPELRPGLLPQGAQAGGWEQVDGRPGPSHPNSPRPPSLPPCLVRSPHPLRPPALSSDREAGRTGRGVKSQTLSLRLLFVGPALPVRPRSEQGAGGTGWAGGTLAGPAQSLLPLVGAP